MTALVAIAVGAAWTFLVYAAADAFIFRPRVKRIEADALADRDRRQAKIVELEARLVKLERGEA